MCVFVPLNKGTKKGVNLPRMEVDLPSISEQDRKDLAFGLEHKVDMIFASFVRSGKVVQDIRELLGEQGATIKIIAKIENHEGVKKYACTCIVICDHK